MFCYQQRLNLPTRAISEALFWGLVRAPRTLELIEKFRATGDPRYKRQLEAFIFQATFGESLSKGGTKGCWRKQAATILTGLAVIDADHLDDPQKTYEVMRELADFDKEGILLVYITPSGKGLKIVFKARLEWGNLIDNQHAMARLLGVEVDESGKDASRMSFICREQDILFINEKELFTYENPEFAARYNEAYRNGNSQPTNGTLTHSDNQALTQLTHKSENNENSLSLPSRRDNDSERRQLSNQALTHYNNVPLTKIIDAWMDGEELANNRHNTLIKLASHLRYLLGRNAKHITEVVMQLPWVKALADEGEDVEGTVKSVMGWRFTERRPEKLVAALRRSGAEVSTVPPDDIYAQLPLDDWASQLSELAEAFPCMKELFLNVHPHKLPAVLFSSAALFGTLMTRSWYHFWYEPEVMRRLNYCIFIIGDPGAGKNVIEKFYFKIADPIIQADKGMIEAVNRYKERRTERTTSTKAQKDEALKKPVVGIRVHPSRTSTGEFIRHMLAAEETVDGMPMTLHMLSFDSELDNVTKNNKGGDWKDREIMELKAFHNEQDGQMYANQESVTGMFNVFWNFIYTGTPYALHRKVNQRNFGTGMSTRLAVIPLPDKGMAERHQEVNPEANETLRNWAYRLDKVSGEIPIEALNDETYEWQSRHLEIAEFNGDKADRTLLKRIPYYGIGVSLPFILMRHWDEWTKEHSFAIDDTDRRLCRLAMEIQYGCQHFFFGEMAFNYFEEQNKEFVVRKRSSRYEDCFRKLPEEFTTQQFMECFTVSQQASSKAITRFLEDGVVQKVKYGLYRKTISELP